MDRRFSASTFYFKTSVVRHLIKSKNPTIHFHKQKLSCKTTRSKMFKRSIPFNFPFQLALEGHTFILEGILLS